jgi:hypothetical protein
MGSIVSLIAAATIANCGIVHVLLFSCFVMSGNSLDAASLYCLFVTMTVSELSARHVTLICGNRQPGGFACNGEIY